jgi:hypothetical protein
MDGWLSLYPNPVKGRLTVEYLLSANADTKMKIYDINGKLLMQEDWQTTMGIKTVDVSSYSEGVYILTIGKQSKEFVVK